MKIVSVIPIARGMSEESLSYFTIRDVRPGTIVCVPLRKKTADALVVETLELKDARSVVKTSGFSLKKIEKIKGLIKLSRSYLDSISRIKDYFAASAGAVFAAALPKIYWDNYDKLAEPPPEDSDAPKNNLLSEKLIFQNNLDERLSFYKTFIRESFAKKKSVWICLPKTGDAEFFAKNLQKGIEEYVVTLHSDMSNKEFTKRYNRVALEDHPLLIVSTPWYLFAVRKNLSAIILERESSGAYKQISRPFIDWRILAEVLADLSGTKIILADTLLRVETLERAGRQELEELLPASFRIARSNEKTLIGPNTDDPKPKSFKALSPSLLERIRRTTEEGGRSFLFVLRKGLAPITICNDCRNLVLCGDCSKPMVLYENREQKRIFACGFCRRREDAALTCQTCRSWNLKPLGVGTESVTEELKLAFPKNKIFRLDKEFAKTPKEAAKIAREFYETDGAILVGTELALHHLGLPLRTVAVVSFDSLWSIPDFRMGEKIIHLLLELNDLADQDLLIQTKNKDDKILRHFMSGNLAEFLRDELGSRQKFNYPPFKTLIKISFRGSKTAIVSAEDLIRREFANYNPLIYRAYVPKIKNTYMLNALLRIEKKNWSLPELARGGEINPALLEKLRALPLSFAVQIDPEDLL